MRIELLAYFFHGYAWTAVVVPGALSVVALAACRSVAFRWPVIAAMLMSLLVSWFTRIWTDAGLQILPTAAVLLLGVWGVEMLHYAPTVRRTLARGAVSAAWTWVTLFAVDVGGCLVEAQCYLNDTGGAGFLDGLVVSPILAAALVVTLAGVAARGEKRRLDHSLKLASRNLSETVRGT
jgi:hypothetical protein